MARRRHGRVDVLNVRADSLVASRVVSYSSQIWIGRHIPDFILVLVMFIEAHVRIHHVFFSEMVKWMW